MILNPSHDIGLKGFPSEILDAYVRYKQGSRAIVSWLVQYGPNKHRGVKTLPIKELAALASSVTNYISELPEIVHFHFRETIAARKRLSQFFRKTVDASNNDADTVNHEHFTTSLAEIYSNLCQQCHKVGRHHHGESRPGSLSEASAKPVRNQYACLPVEDVSDGYIEDRTDEECPESRVGETHRYSPPSELDIENDEMSIAIETASVLERVHQIFVAAATCWEEAGKGHVHFLCASVSANTAWAMLQDLETQLRSIDPGLNFERLHQKFLLFNATSRDSAGPLDGLHDLLESLTESDHAIRHYCKHPQLGAVAKCPSCVQRPADYVQPIERTGTKQTNSFPLALLGNVVHLTRQSHLPAFISHSSPIFMQINYLLTHRDDESTVFQSTLALHLLTISYKAYLTALPRPTTVSSCRITALKLSKQASSILSLILKDKESFPCRCPQTLAFHLSNLKDDMEAYSKHRCWDLFFQSPWVAGNHMIEMLDVLSYYGMRLFHYHHHVAAVLHTYNVMTQLAGLEPVPVLEDLIETFKDVFFPAGRPRVYFRNSWARYIGARLKFKKDHKRHASDRESWCMAVPAHAARSSAGLGIDKNRDSASRTSLDPRFDYARIDPTMRLKQRDWRVESSPGVMLSKAEPSTRNCYDPHSSRTSSTSSSSTNATFTAATSTAHPLLMMLPTLESQLTSSALPTTRLSHAKIYLACTSIIRHATRKIHTNPSDTETKTCICFAHTLLSAADRIVNGRKLGKVECWKKEERKVVAVFRDVLSEEIGGSGRDGIDRADWLWEL